MNGEVTALWRAKTATFQSGDKEKATWTGNMAAGGGGALTALLVYGLLLNF